MQMGPYKEDSGSETPGRSKCRPGPRGDEGCGMGVNLQDEAVGLRFGRVRLPRRGIRGVTVQEGVPVDGGGVGEGGGEHCHRGPARVRVSGTNIRVPEEEELMTINVDSST